MDTFFNAMKSGAPLTHRFRECWCTPCGVGCFDQRSPDHTSDALDALIMHFGGKRHQKGLVEALRKGKEHVQAYRNWRDEEVQLDHQSAEVWLGGKSFWSPRQSDKNQADWSLWQKITNTRLEAAGKAQTKFEGPSDWGNGKYDEGVCRNWDASDNGHSLVVATEQSPGSGSGAPSKSMQGQTEIQPQGLCNVWQASLTLMHELKNGEGPPSIELSSALSKVQRAQLHQKAARLGLKTRSRGPAETRIMRMWRVKRGNARSRSPHQTETDATRLKLGKLTFTALVLRAISDGIEATTIDSCETSDSLTKYKAAIIDLILDKMNWGICGSPPSLHRGSASASFIR
jgi:hypothetical protein